MRLFRLWSSTVTFVAAMTAMYISMRLHLPRPWWVLMAVYVTTQPLAGALRPKMTYRLLGMVAGAAAAVALVPRLVNSPAALCLALAAWIGLCLYLAIQERTPRTFGFMLAAYTAAIVGFPYLDQPGDIFQIALDRVAEMGLGVVCATVAHTVLAPWDPAAALRRRIEGFLADGRLWFADAFRGLHGFEADADRRRFAAAIAELSIIAVHLPPEALNAAASRRLVGALQDQLATLLPLASAVQDRLEALRAEGALTPQIAVLVDEVIAWLASPDVPEGAARTLRARCQAAAPTLDHGGDWSALLCASLCQRLAEFVDAYAASCELARHLTEPARTPSSRVLHLLKREARRPLHRHHATALLSAAAASAALLAYCAVWIVSGWPEGASTAAFAAIISCSFNSQDDPAPAIVKYLGFTVAALPLAALYLFVILPAVDGFTLLAVALAPALLAMGYLQANPGRAPYALPMLACFIVAMGFLDQFTVDYARFFNVAFAQMGGVIVTISAARLFRSVGADWSVRRILRQGWRELAALAQSGRGTDEIAWSHRMHDRVGLVASRTALLAEAGSEDEADALRDLRVGRNIIRLRRAHAIATASAKTALAAVLGQTAHYYERRAARARPLKPPAGLLAGIDDAFGAIAALPPGETRRHGFLALAGLRRNLFPKAPAFAGGPR
jgi:uncharacterized membrane protein YccC